MNKIILFVGTLAGGGAERAVSNISLNLTKELEQEIIIFGDEAKLEYPHSSNINRLDKYRMVNIFDKIKGMISRYKKIKRIKLNNPNSTIISFLEYPNLLNSLSSKSGKTIVSVRNHMSTKYSKGIKSKFWNFTIRFLYSKADKIIVVSEEIKKDLITNYDISEDIIEVIYNSYDLIKIKKLAEEPIESEYAEIFQFPVIITAGRLAKQKGHKHLILAFSEAKKKIPNVQLVILGEGVLKEELEKLCVKLNIRDSVHFIGFQSNPFKYLKNSKVFAMSSFHEGFPNAMAEAMACGIPIVSSDCLSGPREILAPKELSFTEIEHSINKDRYGLLSPVGEDKILAQHLISLLEDQKLHNYFSTRSLERVEDFNIKNTIKKWEKLAVRSFNNERK